MAATAGYGVLTGWTEVTIPLVLIYLAVAILAEIAEFFLGLLGAKRKGGSKVSMAGAFLGGILGAIAGVPLALIGNLIGAFIGAFLGAFFMEWLVRRDFQQALRTGWGAFIGRILSSTLKIALCMGMIVFTFLRVIII